MTRSYADGRDNPVRWLVVMDSRPEISTPNRSRAPAVVALLAGVAGLALLAVGVVRLVGSMDGPSAASTTVGFVTTTTVEAPATTESSDTSETPATTEPVDTSGAPSGVDLVTISDDTGALSLSVPAAWDDRSGLAWSVDGEVVGISVGAAVDRNAWYEGWGTPGVFVGLTTVGPDVYTPELGEFGGTCVVGSTEDREYDGFSVVVQQWVDCGDAGSEFHVAMVWPDSLEYTALIQVVTLDGSGSDLVDTLVTTLRYDP